MSAPWSCPDCLVSYDSTGRPTCNCNKDPMTFGDAYDEAKRRWGKAGHVDVRVTPGHTVYVVGTVGGDRLSNGTWPIGYGDTWEEAFADADKRGGNS